VAPDAIPVTQKNRRAAERKRKEQGAKSEKRQFAVLTLDALLNA
jgi:hypothetical protein